MAKMPSAEDIAFLRERFGEAIADVHERLGEVSAVVDAGSLVEICSFLRDDPRFRYNLLSDLCGVDWGIDADPRFQVNYHLYSIPNGTRLRLKVLVSEDDPTVPTVSGVWKTADWHERETFDFFGIVFDGHPDLRRILMPEEFQWHPLRKDFPVRGYDDF
jgi:NADH-quinone oxidoreductase subunit C